MKPTFKTTALAILVALGVTACGSSGGGSTSENTPSVINPTTPDDNAGNTTNDNTGNTTNDNTGNTTNDNTGNTTNDNTGNTTNDNTGNTTNDNAGNTTNDNAGNTTNDNTGKNDNPVDPITPPTPSDKPEVLGGTWRYVDLENLSNQDDFVQSLLTNRDDEGFVGSGRIDLNALAQGKTGTIEGVASGEELFLGSKQQTEGVKVIFENKPYSTYGFVTVKDENNLDKPGYFAFINADKEGEYSTQAARNVYSKMQERGNAVYEGNVYATINKKSSVTEHFKDNWSAPALDGKVKMSVYVDGNAAKTMRNRGEITSNALNGKITLTNATVNQYNDAVYSNGNAIFNDKQGRYVTEYSSNEAKEMIGSVKLELESDNSKYDGATITEYKAVFGGTADK